MNVIEGKDEPQSHEEEEKKESKQQGLPKAILLLGGSFSPVHVGHVKFLLSLRNYFEEEKKEYHIVAAYLVLSTDRYVWGKLGKNGIKFKHRHKMCELAISECGEVAENFVFPSHVECLHAADYGEMITHSDNHHQFFIQTKLLDDPSQLTQLTDNQYNKLVSIGRSGYTEKVRTLYERDKKKGLIDETIFEFVDMELDEVSSTEIRIELSRYHQIPLEQRTPELKQKIFTALESKISSSGLAYALDNIDDLWLEPLHTKKKTTRRSTTSNTTSNTTEKT
ncbi:hypothetical protein RFI_16476 [Reticulomyxa filosa]|uniref:Cytidyltransferase-like domain-containing protein n=1 Tax=Reticulomyxa filosa TaxID=46433 RepID=X6N384_RETFI|nr:hypothetical protein RFI_16476 [Reticulomyxa filosa]|eukprot:ETO20740.1 hypothetical protein RFI_16476 [Reticulomyxa filosa]